MNGNEQTADLFSLLNYWSIAFGGRAISSYFNSLCLRTTTSKNNTTLKRAKVQKKTKNNKRLEIMGSRDANIVLPSCSGLVFIEMCSYVFINPFVLVHFQWSYHCCLDHHLKCDHFNFFVYKLVVLASNVLILLKVKLKRVIQYIS